MKGVTNMFMYGMIIIGIAIGVFIGPYLYPSYSGGEAASPVRLDSVRFTVTVDNTGEDNNIFSSCYSRPERQGRDTCEISGFRVMSVIEQTEITCMCWDWVSQ